MKGVSDMLKVLKAIARVTTPMPLL